MPKTFAHAFSSFLDLANSCSPLKIPTLASLLQETFTPPTYPTPLKVAFNRAPVCSKVKGTACEQAQRRQSMVGSEEANKLSITGAGER